MINPATNERRLPLHASHTAHRTAARWLAAFVGSLALLLAMPALSHADESNPNNYACLGHIKGGQPEAGSEEQQVQYSFYCDGPITGYQVQAQIPVTGIEGAPLVTSNSTGATRSPAQAKYPATRSTASAWPRPATRRSRDSSRSERSCARSRGLTRF